MAAPVKPVKPATVYIIEVLVQGVWKPTNALYVSESTGSKMAAAMRKDSGKADYRLAAYVRSAP